MALTDDKHLATVKRIQESLTAHVADLKSLQDDIADADDIDDDIKEGLSETIDDLEEIKDDLGGYAGTEPSSD